MSESECWCEWVDIGVGEQRVTDNPECPEHNPEQGAEVPVTGRECDPWHPEWSRRCLAPYGDVCPLHG